MAVSSFHLHNACCQMLSCLKATQAAARDAPRAKHTHVHIHSAPVHVRVGGAPPPGARPRHACAPQPPAQHGWPTRPVPARTCGAHDPFRHHNSQKNIHTSAMYARKCIKSMKQAGSARCNEEHQLSHRQHVQPVKPKAYLARLLHTHHARCSICNVLTQL